MSDKDDPNLTVGPQEARRAVPRISQRPGLTQHLQAVTEKKAAKVAASPGRAMVEAMAQKALGVAVLWWVRGSVDGALKSGDKLHLAIVVGAGVFALYCLAPGLTMAFLKFGAGLLPFKGRGDPPEGTP